MAAILPARERDEVGATWYAGTADAIYQNLDFLDRYDPEYVLILSEIIFIKWNTIKC